MTPEELRNRTRKLSEDIHDLIVTYTNETGFYIQSIRLNYSDINTHDRSLTRTTLDVWCRVELEEHGSEYTKRES